MSRPVLQEAGSSRYKSALHSRTFDKAVKKYRKKQLQEGKQRPRPILNKQNAEKPGSTSGSPHGHQAHAGAKPTAERFKESQEISQRALETLPGEVIKMSKQFQESMQFFVAGGADGTNPLQDRDAEGENGDLRIPPEMRTLLDELCNMETINERVKSEILQDEDARKTLFMLSLERESPVAIDPHLHANPCPLHGLGSFKRLVTSAEKALSALADRDALASITAAQRPLQRHQSILSTVSAGGTSDEAEDDDPRDHIRAQSEPALPSAHHPHVRHARQVHPKTSQTRDMSPTGRVSRGESSRSTPRAYTPAVAEDMPSSSSSSYVMS